MSASAILALRKAIRALLVQDIALTALLGGPKIYDEAPREAVVPYVTFGDAQLRDWSTVSDHGAEQFVVLTFWSSQRGLREALEAAARAAILLDEPSLVLEGHRLISLRLVSQETRRDANGRFARASLRLRAVTETL